MSSSTGWRVLGVGVPDVSDWREQAPQGKWSQFFSALADRVEVVDVLRPPSWVRPTRHVNLARTFHPLRSRWKSRAGFSRWLARERTRAVQHLLDEHLGEVDLIMQLQTLFTPGVDRHGTPYAVYTDSTMAATRRLYPPRAHLSQRESRWWMDYEADICRSAAAVYTYSQFARHSVIEDYGCSPDRTAAVGAGANQMLPSLAEKDYAAHRVLFVGIDFKIKGGHVLLEAWPEVRRRIPDAELVIAGPRRRPVRRLPDGVSWAGWLDRVELAHAYESATLFVMPSLFEAWGHAFIEAMGYGLPCVGTDCCAMPEIIEEGVTGRLVPRFEAQPLADAIVGLLNDPAAAAEMGRTAHERVVREHRWGEVAERVVGHLAATVALHPRVGRSPAG